MKSAAPSPQDIERFRAAHKKKFGDSRLIPYRQEGLGRFLGLGSFVLWRCRAKGRFHSLSAAPFGLRQMSPSHERNR